MKQNIVRLIDHYGLLALLVLVVVVTLLGFYRHWTDLQQLQALSSLAITVLLAAITWQYVRTTQKTLDFYRDQWQLDHQFRLRFGMKISNGKPWIRIANPGGVRFMVTKAVFTERSNKPHTLNTYTVLSPGETGGFYVPRVLYENEQHNADIDVTLHYEYSGRPEETVSRAFRIEMLHGKVYGIKAGVHGIWQVNCPKCRKLGGWMLLDGLENLQSATSRETEMKEELSATCPNHQSQWADTVEQIRERNRVELERGTEE